MIIRGHQRDDEGDRIYLHRGIAARQFQRSFVLADGIEVRGASLDNGLLHIELERVIPESKARKIPIGSQSKEEAFEMKSLENKASKTEKKK